MGQFHLSNVPDELLEEMRIMVAKRHKGNKTIKDLFIYCVREEIRRRDEEKQGV